LRKKIGKIIVKPSTLAKDEDIYYNIVANVWNDFDKIPHRKPALNNDWDYFKQFKQDVIIPLKLKPDKS
jgi:hypothetical protein